MKVYVYQDTDNDVLEVFHTLEAAKSFCYEHWGKEIVEEFGWEKGSASWGTCEYVTIFKRDVK